MFLSKMQKMAKKTLKFENVICKNTHFVYTLFRYAGDVFNNAQNYIDQSFSRGEHFGNPRLVFICYLYKMVTQNMLRTHGAK